MALNAEQEAYRARARTLNELVQHPGWDLYCEELEKLEKDAMERLIHDDEAVVQLLRGKIQGLRSAVYCPAHIIDSARRMSTDG